VLIRKKMYAFKFGSPVSVCKYEDWTRTEHLVKTALSTLPRNEYLQIFSICHVAGKIVLTGGKGEDEDEEEYRDNFAAQTFVMDLATERW